MSWGGAGSTGVEHPSDHLGNVPISTQVHLLSPAAMAQREQLWGCENRQRATHLLLLFEGHLSGSEATVGFMPSRVFPLSLASGHVPCCCRDRCGCALGSPLVPLHSSSSSSLVELLSQPQRHKCHSGAFAALALSVLGVPVGLCHPLMTKRSCWWWFC